MSDKIECKPTPWFLLRAGAMLLMFGIFAVLFYKDGSTGYREKNLSYYTWTAFERAASEFGKKSQSMDAAEWREYASRQEIELPDDRDILPADTPESIPWPEMLRDYETVSNGLTNPKTQLFDVYRERVGMTASPPDKAFHAGKIHQQWVVFWICLALFLGALFVLLRTLSRKIVLDGGTLYPAAGKPVEISDLVRLDLRRWDRKGIAFAWAKTAGGGERKIRIDGLTYGGFKPEEGEPAEQLMRAIKSGFSGELIEYVEEDEPDPETGEPESSDAPEASDHEAETRGNDPNRDDPQPAPEKS